jgi:uncharacterized protein DUF3237
MRLEPLFLLSMRYAEGTWARPFGGEEGAGFGSGEGTVTGDVLRGTVRWANAPRRREDGVWTPNLRGVIRTEDDADILLSIHGQSVQERTGPGRAILARLELMTEDERYRWLNTTFVVGEGEIDEDTEEWWIHAFVGVNEIAQHAPGIGQPPPEAFR